LEILLNLISSKVLQQLAPHGVLSAGVYLGNFLLVTGRSSTGEPIGIALEDGWIGIGTFSSDALPYIRPDLKLSDYIEDEKLINQPNEVVYVFRAKPDSQLHAKLIELLLEWEDDYDLLGSEVSYVLE
jgi:hypothetical protein